MNPNFDKLNTVIIHPTERSWDLYFVLLGVFGNFSQCFRIQQISDHKTVYNRSSLSLREKKQIIQKIKKI